MSEILFRVSCPSCETVFEIVDPELVGQIVACPKCGGMLLVKPPEDVPAESIPAVETPSVDEATPIETAEPSDCSPSLEPPVVETEPPVIEKNSETETNEEDSDDESVCDVSWRKRLILTLSGVICALVLVLALRYFRSSADLASDGKSMEVASSAPSESTEGARPSNDSAGAEDDAGLDAELTEVPADAEDSPIIERDPGSESSDLFDSRGIVDVE